MTDRWLGGFCHGVITAQLDWLLLSSQTSAGAPRRRWGLVFLPVAITLLSLPFESFARRFDGDHPWQSGIGDYDVLASVLGVKRDLALAVILAAFVVARRSRPADSRGLNPARLPLALGVIAALLWTALSSTVYLLRSRSLKNELAAAAHHGVLLNADRLYAVVNGGLHDQPACLLAPERCLPAAKRFMSPLLDDSLSRNSCYGDPVPACHLGGGYTYRWVAGPAAAEDEIRRRGASASSVVAAAWLATPTVPLLTGLVAFCGDSTGRVCWVHFVDSKQPFHATGGLCPRECFSFQ